VGCVPLRDPRSFPSSAYNCPLHQTLPTILAEEWLNAVANTPTEKKLRQWKAKEGQEQGEVLQAFLPAKL